MSLHLDWPVIVRPRHAGLHRTAPSRLGLSNPLTLPLKHDGPFKLSHAAQKGQHEFARSSTRVDAHSEYAKGCTLGLNSLKYLQQVDWGC
jgi:hypothetical protein